MNSQDETFLIRWSTYGPYRAAALRSCEGWIARPYTDYLDQAAASYDSGAKSVSSARSDIEAKAYALRAFAHFLTIQKPPTPLYRVTDKVLSDFKKHVLAQVQASKASRGLGPQQKETTNIKLRVVYDFLYWCQAELLLPRHTIGWLDIFRVRSSLALAHERGNDSDLRAANKYPLCYRGLGEGRPNGAQHWATQSDLDKIESAFWTDNTSVTANRNGLMLRVLDSLAWRVGSANSLRASQFSALAIKSQDREDFYTVTPKEQKGAKSRSFDMSWELAHHIQHYCEDRELGRHAILNARGVGEEVAKDALFLSTTTGKPLLKQSWVRVFAAGFKAAGAPKGAGAHAIRRKRGDEEFRDEIEYRQAMGLPVTFEAVAPAVQEKLGHSNVASQRSYRRSMLRLRRQSRQEELTTELEKMQIVVSDLRAQISTLMVTTDRKEK